MLCAITLGFEPNTLSKWKKTVELKRIGLSLKRSISKTLEFDRAHRISFQQV